MSAVVLALVLAAFGAVTLYCIVEMHREIRRIRTLIARLRQAAAAQDETSEDTVSRPAMAPPRDTSLRVRP